MYTSPKEYEKNITAKLLCGSAGLLGQTITYPLDVVRRQMQVVPSVAIGFTVYDLMKAFLEVSSREEVAAEMKAADSSRQSSLIYSG